MKTERWNEWMIEAGEIMNRWYSRENRHSNTLDLYIPRSFWILKAIHEQGEKFKTQKDGCDRNG